MIALELSYSANRSEKGFTLIEVMVAMIILAAGVIGLISMFETSFRANTNGRNMTIANRLMAKHIEELRAVSFDNVATRINTDADYSNKSLTTSTVTIASVDYSATTIVATYVESGATMNQTSFGLEVKRIADYPFAGIDKILVTATWSDRFGSHGVPGITYVESF